MNSDLQDFIEVYKPTTVQLESDGDNVMHFVALPNGQTSIENVEFPENPIVEYSFQLDPFQKKAISCIHRNESVLVSAHTSSGKTAIALYAVKSAINQNSRVVYTSPIKALSNQKYRELQNQYGEVGLITGDVTINPNAPILVMTTEILRMMLYRGDELIRELTWVIYDEIHYMRDIERGVVWEESIIMLPDAVKFVFLSATIPNARDFSEWIASIHNQPCHVVYTERRPVPLKFYLSPVGNPDPILVKDGDKIINYQAVEASFNSINAVSSKKSFKGIEVQDLPEKDNKIDKKTNNKSIVEIADILINTDLSPMIIFAFGRKLCEELSECFNDKCYVTEEESQQINELLNISIEKLDDNDKKLPQIENTKNLIMRGIGVHHGGLIPLMKELVELLFQYGLLKVLFATETFSMGINMPARTVVFHSVSKFDGERTRLLSGGEFIQMSGRAGRRNNDSFGAVVLSLTGETQIDQILQLLQAISQPLNSEFHITYHMLLSLLSTRLLEPEDLMKKSFRQFQMEKELPELNKRNKELILDIDSTIIPEEDIIKKQILIEEQIQHWNEEKRKIEYRKDNLGSRIQNGRLVKIKQFEWGVAISNLSREGEFKILLAVDDKFGKIKPTNNFDGASACVFSVKLSDIEFISDLIPIPQGHVRQKEINNIFSLLSERFKKGIQPLLPLNYITNELEKYEKATFYLTQLDNTFNKIKKADPKNIEIYKRKKTMMDQLKNLQSRITSINKAVMHRDLIEMRKVLEKLNFVNEEGLITDKGRVASVISAGDEIVITEVLFSGIISDLPPQQIAALFSAFASDEGNNEESSIPEILSKPWEEISKIILKIFDISIECGRDLDREKFFKKFDGSFIHLTYNWACGSSFIDIVNDFPDVFEGGIIRTMKRTEEILRQAQRAANVMGNSELEIKLLSSIQCIKRDIIFAASLYL